MRHGLTVYTCMGFLYVCLFSILLEIFHSYGDITFTGEGLEILTYARHSWLLRSEDSLACQTYRNTGHPFTIVISEDP